MKNGYGITFLRNNNKNKKYCRIVEYDGGSYQCDNYCRMVVCVDNDARLFYYSLARTRKNDLYDLAFKYNII